MLFLIVPVIQSLSDGSIPQLTDWVASDKNVLVKWEDTTVQSLERVFQKFSQIENSLQSGNNQPIVHLDNENTFY